MARAILKGTALSPGIAIGPLKLLPDSRIYEKRPIGQDQIEDEIDALQKASLYASASLRQTIDSIPDNLAEYREIVSLQMELARDPRILNGAIARIRSKQICAAWALSETIAELASLFQNMADPYLSGRAQDIRAIGQLLLEALSGGEATQEHGTPGILAAYDLAPANIMDFRPDAVMGLLTVEGGLTSHTAILARSLKVPAIGGVTGLFREARDGESVILDGLTGEAIIGPTAQEAIKYRQLRRRHIAFETEARQAAQTPAVTRDGLHVSVLANLENQQEMHELLRCGAEGVGLFRTEFSWLKSNGMDEEALFKEYDAILRSAARKNVIFRTLDVGADKALPVQDALHEPNPALGLRGIRFCLNRPDIFMPQLKALLRAGINRNMALMLPMVTRVEEVREFRKLMKEACEDLAGRNIAYNPDPDLGIMIETPAAVLISRELSRECDFISLGTNDLLHYIMAIDRNNRHVSYLHDPLHPAFMRAIKDTAEAAHAEGKRVSVCGELAADPMGIAILVGLGVDSLSATPRFIPSIKHTLRKLDSNICREIAATALAGAESSKTRALLRKALEECMGSQWQAQTSIIRG